MSHSHNSDYYVRIAKDNHLPVEEGGNHTKVFGSVGRGYMAIPRHKTLSKGVECSIKKWFRQLGIMLMLVVPLALSACGIFSLWMGK